jgi:hypothetical protein
MSAIKHENFKSNIGYNNNFYNKRKSYAQWALAVCGDAELVIAMTGTDIFTHQNL